MVSLHGGSEGDLKLCIQSIGKPCLIKSAVNINWFSYYLRTQRKMKPEPGERWHKSSGKMKPEPGER